MLAEHWHVADLIGRAGRVHVDTAAAKERLAALSVVRPGHPGFPAIRHFALSIPVINWQVLTAIRGTSTTSLLSRFNSE